jgi:hypothetical protein
VVLVAATGALVVMMRVVVPELITGLVVKLRVGGSTAPLGLLVIAAISCTLPVKPPLGLIVMVEVFPLVAPAAIVTAVPPMVNAGVAAGGGGTYVVT